MKDTKRYKKEFKNIKKLIKFKPGRLLIIWNMMLTIIIAGAIDGIFQFVGYPKLLKEMLLTYTYLVIKCQIIPQSADLKMNT